MRPCDGGSARASQHAHGTRCKHTIKAAARSSAPVHRRLVAVAPGQRSVAQAGPGLVVKAASTRVQIVQVDDLPDLRWVLNLKI